MQGCDMRRLFVSISSGTLLELAHIGRSEKRPGLLWGSHGGPLGPSWAVVRPLGPSWGSLGPSCKPRATKKGTWPDKNGTRRFVYRASGSL